jgi:hypothetical protein
VAADFRFEIRFGDGGKAPRVRGGWFNRFHNS